MKILHISTFQKGGAAIAAMRLHQSLIANGYDSKFLFLECKESKSVFKYKKRNYLIDFLLKVVKKLEIPLSINEYEIKKHKQQFETFSFAATPYTTLHSHPLVKNADIINLHWIANFVDHNTFFRNTKKPIIWTLHDMLPFQGGFHYKEDEIRCPKDLIGLNSQQYTIKRQALNQKEADSITVIAPSNWLLNLSKHSELLGRFLHKHIPYGIDVNVFKLLNKEKSKVTLGLSKEKVVVLFVAENLRNHRKGFDMVLELIRDDKINSICSFIAVGKVKKNHQISEIKYLGTISDEKNMSVIYNAADIFIIPSREDNLPNTMIESLCCGTPVVGFSIGGLKEAISNNENGILANNISVSELKDALMDCIKNNKLFNRDAISAIAHLKYSSEIQLKFYLNIYNKYLNTANHKSEIVNN